MIEQITPSAAPGVKGRFEFERSFNMPASSKVRRLVHVLGTFDYGGVESSALGLIHSLDPERFRHVVLCTSASGNLRIGELKSINNVELMMSPFDGKRKLASIRRCARALRKTEADCVLMYSFGMHAWVAIAATLAGIRRRYVRVIVAGDPARDSTTRWKSLVMAHLARPWCDGEIAVSHAVAMQLATQLWLPQRRIITICNGCNVQEIASKSASARTSRSDPGVLRLVMVSRMDDAKDHDTLLRTIALVGQTIPAVQLWLIGDGPRRRALEALASDIGIADSVQFLGNCTNIPELLGLCDILVHSTHTEGLSIALIEAMSAGLPVVCSDIRSCREVLDEGRAGVLVPGQDPAATAKAIVALWRNPLRRHELAAAAFARVRAKYDLRDMVLQYEGLLSR